MRFLRSGSIEVLDRGAKDTLQLLLLQDEQVIETLAPHTAQKAFTDGIGVFRVIGCFQDLDAAGCCHTSKTGTKFLSRSRMRYFGPCSKGVAYRSCCAVQASVGERVTPTWMTLRECRSRTKKANSERKKRSVTCKK